MLSLDDQRKELLLFANKKRKSGLFNDVNIQVENEKFPCNKMVLSCYSKYFDTMFHTEMLERYQDTVELKGFESRCVKMLIDYMYGEVIFICSSTVLQLLKAADYLQMQKVKDFCVDYFHKSLTVENCLDSLFACMLHMPNLSLKYVYQYLSNNFVAITQQKTFQNLAYTDLTSLFKNLNQSYINQKPVFLAIADWTAHDQINREMHFTSLFETINLTKISCESLLKVVLVNPLVTDHHACCVSVVKELTKRFKLTEDGVEICNFGGENRSEVFTVPILFGQTLYPNLPMKLSYHTAEKVDAFVYCIGGIENDSRMSSTAAVYRMNLEEDVKKWVAVASMNEERFSHATCVFEKNIVVSGGYVVYRYMDSVEMYETSEDEWKDLQPLNTSRSRHAMVTCDGCLYVIGGGRGYDYLSSVEKLQDLESKWEFVQPLNAKRLQCAAVTLNGNIYAIGGSGIDIFDHKTGKSVEKFEPSENKWSFVSEMNFVRIGPAACVIGGRIFVVGGERPKGDFSTLECYDPTDDTWSVINDHVDYLEGHAVTSVLKK